MKDFFGSSHSQGGGHSRSDGRPRSGDIFNLARRYDLFKRSLLKHSYITMTDNSELTAENVMKIISCERDLIRLKLAVNTATVTGSRLTLDIDGGDNFAGDAGVVNVTVRGKINDVCLECN